MSKPISAYQLGETYAQNMGVNIKVFRILLILLSSILSACVTAFAGPISFVGIAVPHIAKSLLKTAKPLLVIPACFLGGAVFCLFCDLIARTVFAPTELEHQFCDGSFRSTGSYLYHDSQTAEDINHEIIFFYTDQLTVGYDGRPLIKEINIQLNKGEILTLIGPNGAGKSTILKSITRQLS